MVNILSNLDQIPVRELVDVALSQYGRSAGDPFQGFRPVTAQEQQDNEERLEKQLASLRERLEQRFAHSPARSYRELSPQLRGEVKGLFLEFLLEMDEARVFFQRPFLRFFAEKGYLDVAEAFLERAGQEETTLEDEEVFQALRNVWIMNSLQIAWAIPLGLSPSIYAYSMLYPYTDNFLDDPGTGLPEKVRFNAFLSQVLEGKEARPLNFHEEKVAALIAQIEGQYPRAQFPGVFQSLRLIQDAQAGSLGQASDALENGEILPLSFYKGGASVLADAWLVKGAPDRSEQEFAFIYGTFLQLLDDLQDAPGDRQEGHRTLFSTKEDSEYVDKELTQLMSYIQWSNRPKGMDSPDMAFMKEVIGSCTMLMVLAAAAKIPHWISPDLYQRLNGISPVRLGYYEELQGRLLEMVSAMKAQAEGRSGTTSKSFSS